MLYDGLGERLHCTPEPPIDTLFGEGGADGAGGATGAGAGADLITFVSETVVVTTGDGVGFASTGLTTGFAVSAFLTC
ncbi:hypothetical protein D3C72_1916020 [compost metagenome]